VVALIGHQVDASKASLVSLVIAHRRYALKGVPQRRLCRRFSGGEQVIHLDQARNVLPRFAQQAIGGCEFVLE